MASWTDTERPVAAKRGLHFQEADSLRESREFWQHERQELDERLEAVERERALYGPMVVEEEA